MKDVLATCKPRPEILAGTFNPAIFTARLSQVLDDYRLGNAVEGADSLYSDPVAFFRDATHPTQGLRSIVDNAMARLVEGDKSRPAMQRLDTAFGGGKTHTLIALTHIAKQGSRLESVTQSILPANRLPEPGAIRVVGVIGDTVDTLRETAGGDKPKPNTLWWLIAQQTLEESARQPIASRLDSSASPGSPEFFDALFAGKKTVVIVDEIAQYLSRMEAAFPGQGAEQAAAFLMGLSTYAESNDNLAIVISLASATNAFGDFNKMMQKLMSTHEMTEEEAEATAGAAHKMVMDVVSRASESTTPVQEGDLSRIMAKRLFLSVDHSAAAEVADEFIETYRQAGSDLPAATKNSELRDQLVTHYPFHPTLIEFLSQKLALVESFQGTRGLLRTLARVIRCVWEAKLDIPLIQTGHIDLSDGTIRSELLGKTGNTSFAAVLDSDISKASGTQTTGQTVANMLDTNNPHPDGYPVHEWSWRVVFLHSLVGQGGGLNDEKFGIDITSAIYEMASPAIKPATVRSALETIEREANYLRARENRLYADTIPTLNNILRRIEANVSPAEAMERVEQVVRGLIKSSLFDVRANISESDEIPDKVNKPQLGIVAFNLENLVPSEFVERRADAPRQYQNLVFLLVPGTVHLDGQHWNEQRTRQEHRTRQNILALAGKAIAIERLKADPDNWGVRHDQLNKDEFKQRAAKSPQELRTAVDEAYRYLVYPGRDGGKVVTRDLGKRGSGPTAGGSSGLHLEDAIFKQLTDEGELITEERATTQETLILLNKLIFETHKQVNVNRIVEFFATRRHWPILQKPTLLADVLREGSNRGVWCVGHLAEKNADKPEVLYHKESPAPLTEEFSGDGWIVCTREHAKQMGWLESVMRNPDTISKWAEQAIETAVELDSDKLQDVVQNEHDKVDPNILKEQLTHLLAQKKVVAYPKSSFKDGKPDPDQAQTGNSIPLEGVTGAVVVPYHVAQERGWIKVAEAKSQTVEIQNAQIVQLLNLLSGKALEASKTEINALQILGLTADKTQFQIQFGKTTLGELVKNRDIFAGVKTRIKFDQVGKARLGIGEVDPACKFMSYIDQIKS
ncbi:DUF499 domain-containing protein [Marinobacter sp. DY40_1A1]|uniref:DUF499 domain-containing protein n=1 Tax=Marinobacter sp. DY40_1A1 TaxID=2583229 RepID=UPI001902F72E|nr:DUF499 domain-containing protein [Marinobacter sp. DY40_1A1]MBK1887784.1 ATP-binding protein [Marinobacter sp. DY40_1A1]